MNTYIIDSHILIWWLKDDPNLSETVKHLIENENNNIFVSVATVWEIGIKQAMGKLNVSADLLHSIIENDFQLLSINGHHADCAAKLPLHHKDPFDRILIAQAIIEQIPIISQDSIFNAYLPFPFIKH